MSAPSRTPSAALRELTSLYGIQRAYTDIFGRRRAASTESLLAILGALGAPIHGVANAPDALRERRLRQWQRALEPVAVAWNGRPGEIGLRLEAKRAQGPAHFRISSETGEEFEWESRLENLPTEQAVTLEGQRYLLKRILTGQRLAPGYHRLQVQTREGVFDSLVISAPPRAYVRPEKTWGVFVPLYALHSRASWGAGDFSDLGAFQKWVAQLGGRAVATLPFLAAFLEEPIEISPYMPASRLYWNEFYVDPRKAPEFQECAAAQSLANSSQRQQEIEALQHSPLVDFPRLMALKRPVIEAMAQWFAASRSGRHAAFEDYVRSHPLLSDYAAFRAVLRRRQAPWPAWPQPLREGAVGENDYAAEERSYHLYAQWLAEEQIASFANLGNGSNLYLDFPLGVHPHSYDVWRERDIFALGASAGAPPDTLFTKGQYWSFPPLHPETIRDQGYSYLIACLRHQLRHASWFRVDHVMGLHRLFWIPQGLEPKEGVYVQYRPEEMYAILSLESHRSKTVVVGENLGTVPAAVNRAMERHGLHQMYVLQYAATPSPKRPLRPVPKNAVASLNTHDMPPFGGFFAGGDIEDMQKLGAFDEREAREQSSRRQKLRRSLEDFFRVSAKRQTAAHSGRLAQKCLEWLARSPARMVLINLEDLWLETAPQNVPGTSTERPNWKRKARYGLEEFTRMAGILRALRKVHRLRPSSAPEGKPK